jgi:predicted small lipoprotein YifL
MTTPSAARPGRLSFATPVRLAALTSLFTLAACGGGGGDSAPPAPAPAPAATTTTMSGVAAAGAAFTGATVTVTDSRGTVVGSTSAPPIRSSACSPRRAPPPST